MSKIFLFDFYSCFFIAFVNYLWFFIAFMLIVSLQPNQNIYFSRLCVEQ